MKWSSVLTRCLGVLALSCGSSWAQRSGTEFVPGEVLVKFRPEVSKARRSQILAGESAKVVRQFETVGIDHLVLPEGTDVISAVAHFLARNDVELAQPNYIRHLDSEQPPNDPYWLQDAMWGLLKVQAQPAWRQFTSGNGTVVLADIDTGANYNHPDLAANIWQNPGETPGDGIDNDGNGYIDDVHGIDVVNHDGDPADDAPQSHGTHTAGTMAAIGNNDTGVVGVCWNAKIVVCKAFNAAGNGEDADLIECLNYVIALRHRGINLRATNNSYSGKLAPNEPFETALKAAFDAAGAAGILNVCSSGNQSTNSDSDPAYPAAFDSSSIIAVGSSDESDNRSYFSNYGAISVDLAAPGSNIISTTAAGYGTLSGTSMSAPHVTGAIALLSQLNPNASAETLKSLLMQNVDVLPQWTGLSVTGGRLNVFRAAKAALAGTAPFPITVVNHPGTETFALTWDSVPGMRYQIYSTAELTSSFASLSGVIIAGAGEETLTFTDLAATAPRKFYQVRIVP